jgi:hypothetical protein
MILLSALNNGRGIEQLLTNFSSWTVASHTPIGNVASNGRADLDGSKSVELVDNLSILCIMANSAQLFHKL